MKNTNRLELMTNLLLIDNPRASDEELIKGVYKEFNEIITQDDLNVMYASRLPDNFEIESKTLEYYGQYAIY